MNEKSGSAKIKLISSMLVFGTIGIFVKFIGLPSSIIACVRGFIGAAFLLVLSSCRKGHLDIAAIKANLLKLCISGALIGANWILLFEAYNYTTVATATLCYYLAPVFVILSSTVLFKEKLTVKKCVCVVISLIGMFFVSGVADGAIPQMSEIFGIILGVAAAVIYAAVVILNKRITNINANDKTIVQLLCAAIVVIPYIALNVKISDLTFTPMTVILLVVVGVVNTGIAYSLYFGSLNSLTAQSIAILSYLDPITAILLSTVILKERLTVSGMIGAVLILGATLFGEIETKKKTA